MPRKRSQAIRSLAGVHRRRPFVAIPGLVLGALLGALVLFAPSGENRALLTTGSLADSGTPEPQAPLSESVPPSAADDQNPFAGIDQPPPAPPQRTDFTTYVIQPGDTVWEIAQQFNLRPETILWSNNITNPDLIIMGQKLTIPPIDGVSYTVQDGDHLADVANRYGVDVASIIKIDKLADPDQLVTGTDLFLPGGRPLAPTASAPQAVATDDGSDDGQVAASVGTPIPLPDNIDDLLAAGWLQVTDDVPLYRTADANASVLDQLPSGTQVERVDGVSLGRIEVRDPGDGHTRQAMSGWVDAVSLDVGHAPPSRALPLSYPEDTLMDLPQVFAPYRTQLDGSAYEEANCGPTAVGMAMAAFGVSLPAPTVRAEALAAQHMSGNNVGTLITALADVVQQNGLTAYGLLGDDGSIQSWSTDDVRAQLQLDDPVVVQVRYRSLPGRENTAFYGDHYILVTGLVPDGFLYNDPIDYDGLGWDRVMSDQRLDMAMNASDSRYSHAAFGVGQ